MPSRRSSPKCPPGAPQPALRPLRVLLLTAALATAGGMPVLAQDDAPLKAAIVFNVLNFVQWPGEAELPAGTPLRLCVERGSALWPHLAGLGERMLRRFRLEPRELADGDSLRGCQVLLLDAGAGHRRTAPGSSPALLTVGSDERYGDGEVVLGLRHANGRVVFDIDLAAAHRNGLQISSKLLRLARAVRE